MQYHLAPGVTHCTTNGAICGKYNIFCRPDEAMLFVMIKVFLHLQNVLLFRTLEVLTLIMNNFKPYTHKHGFSTLVRGLVIMALDGWNDPNTCIISDFWVIWKNLILQAQVSIDIELMLWNACSEGLESDFSEYVRIDQVIEKSSNQSVPV